MIWLGIHEGRFSYHSIRQIIPQLDLTYTNEQETAEFVLVKFTLL